MFKLFAMKRTARFSTGAKLLCGCALLLLSFMNTGKRITVYAIGDSTMADASPADNYPGRGWMQMARPFFNDQVTLVNCARSGRSSKSFTTEGHWQKTLAKIKEGDYVFIQFGHNDQKPDTARHTEPAAAFRDNLVRYINETRERKAFPILFTSIVRRQFGKNGKLEDTHGEYVSIVRTIAKEQNVPLVDLNRKTAELVEKMGPEDSKKLFLYINPGVTSKFPDGKKDDTHLCVYGAEAFARLASEGIKELNIPLSDYIISPATPTNAH